MALRTATLAIFWTAVYGSELLRIPHAIRQNMGGPDSCINIFTAACGGDATTDTGCIDAVCGTTCLTEIPLLSSCCQGTPNLEDLVSCVSGLLDGSSPSLTSEPATQVTGSLTATRSSNIASESASSPVLTPMFTPSNSGSPTVASTASPGTVTVTQSAEACALMTVHGNGAGWFSTMAVYALSLLFLWSGIGCTAEDEREWSGVLWVKHDHVCLGKPSVAE